MKLVWALLAFASADVFEIIEHGNRSCVLNDTHQWVNIGVIATLDEVRDRADEISILLRCRGESR